MTLRRGALLTFFMSTVFFVAYVGLAGALPNGGRLQGAVLNVLTLLFLGHLGVTMLLWWEGTHPLVIWAATLPVSALYVFAWELYQRIRADRDLRRRESK